MQTTTNFTDSISYSKNLFQSLEGASAYTLRFKFYITDASTTQYLIGNRSGATYGIFNTVFNFSTSGILTAISGSTQYVRTGTLALNREYDCVVVFDGTLAAASRAKIYIDGSDATAVAQTVPATCTNVQNLVVGGYDGIEDFPTGSYVKEVEVFDIALTAEDVKDLYEQDTYSELEHPLIHLPLKSWYYDGSSNAVTKNVGTLGGTATLGNGTTTTTFPTQLAPHGMSFDGTDYLQLNKIYTNYQEPFTFAALVYLTNINAEQAILSNRDSSNNGIHFRVYSGGRLQLYIFSSGNYIGRATGADALARQGLYSIIGSYDGSATSAGLSIYIDGERVDTSDSNSGAYSSFTSTDKLNIGRRPTAANALSNGKVYSPMFLGESITPIQARKLHHDMINKLNV